MLMYGTIQALQETDKTIVYNFSSLNESYPRLRLYPPREFGGLYDLQFDINYASWIMNNDVPFYDLINVVYNLYLGYDVFLLVDEWLASLNESLLKFIQQRYGYNANLINTLDDFLLAEESSFTEMGLYNLDIDKERMAIITEKIRQDNGGKPYVEDGYI